MKNLFLKPINSQWLLLAILLCTTVVVILSKRPFFALFALAQALIIQLVSNLIYAIWFVFKMILAYVMWTAVDLMMNLYRTDQPLWATTKQYMTHCVSPFFTQMFVFFFTTFIDQDRLGVKIESIADELVAEEEERCQKQQQLIDEANNQRNEAKQIPLNLIDYIKKILQILLKRTTDQSKDVEKKLLVVNKNLNNCTIKQTHLKPGCAAKIPKKKQAPMIWVNLSNGEKRVRVQALISSSSSCSLITRNTVTQLGIEAKAIWPIVVRESIHSSVRVCTHSALVRMEAVKPHEHVCHQIEMLVVDSIKEPRNNFPTQTVDIIIGQDIFNWTVNILPMQRTTFLQNGLTTIDTKYGRAEFGEEGSKNLANYHDADRSVASGTVEEKVVPIKYRKVQLPWRREQTQREAQTSNRDCNILLAIFFGLGMVTYFDLLFLITMMIAGVVAMFIPIWCFFARYSITSKSNVPKLLFHSALKNIFIFFYVLKLAWKWVWKQSSNDSKDPVLYKPTLKVRVITDDVECECRVAIDTTRTESYISHRVVQHLGEANKLKSTICVQMQALDDKHKQATVELVVAKQVFWDYLPAAPRELREVISIQHGIKLTDDTPESETFGSADIIIGTGALTEHFLLSRSACIYLGPNLTLMPTRFGWTLAGSHYPLLNKSLDTIYTNHSRVVNTLSHHLIPFLVRLMTSTVVISMFWDIAYYIAIVSRIQNTTKPPIVANCSQFPLKVNNIPYFDAAGYCVRMVSCWLYSETFNRLLPYW